MKIALCFLTYDALSQQKLWSKIIDNNKDKLSVYIHNKTDFNDNDENYSFSKYVIPQRIATIYSHKSLVQATLCLLREALKSPENAFFILLSDKCIPLHSIA